MAVIIDKMVINFKIINFKKNLCNIVKKKKKNKKETEKYCISIEHVFYVV